MEEHDHHTHDHHTHAAAPCGFNLGWKIVIIVVGLSTFVGGSRVRNSASGAQHEAQRLRSDLRRLEGQVKTLEAAVKRLQQPR